MRTWRERIKWVRRALIMICLVAVAVSRLNGDMTDPQIKELFQQASDTAKRGNLDGAIAALTQAIELDPKLAPAYYNRGLFYQIKHDYAKAIADFNEAIEINPNLAPAYNNLAWIYATNPDSSFRNGKKALELATKACELTQYGKVEDVESLAAACAETGDFDSAVRWQKVIITMPGVEPETVGIAKARLALYVAHKPFHESK
jgi:tetratricopeptide (TPR) repeat protein